MAAALRLYELGQWSFWIDEAHTYRDATMPMTGDYSFWNQERAFYPLTFLGLRFLIDAGLVGAGEGWLRLPFALGGIATVPLMWWCGRRLLGDGAAAVSAWLLALMPWHLFWSQNARGYVFVVFTAVLAAGRLWRWTETGRRRHLLQALAAIITGALFHPSAAFQGFGVLAFVVLRRLRTSSPRGILIAAGAALAVLLVLPHLIESTSLFEGFVKTKTDASLLHLLSTIGYYFRPILLVSALIGFLLLRRDQELEPGRDRGLFLGCLAVAQFAVLAVLGGSLVKTTARYAICALPALLWLAAAGARELAVLTRPGASPGLRLVAGFIGIAVFADFSTECWHYYAHRHGDRPSWRDACEWVKEHHHGERVHVLTLNEPSLSYYLTPEKWRNAGIVEGPYTINLLAYWSNEGKDENHVVLHPEGWREHLQWRRGQAEKEGASLVVIVKKPELDEIDQGDAVDRAGELWRLLRTEWRLALYLPCWVG
ncbi:MAG: glycosyltransferase family 39 protein, partial [Planctomycetes bacterium]|nr:glycosyltransferase family 39 protein [Planctomycetota bacterium]